MDSARVRYVLSKIYIDDYAFVHVIDRKVFYNIDDLIKESLQLDVDSTFFISHNTLPIMLYDGEYTYIIYKEKIGNTGGVMFGNRNQTKSNTKIFW